MTSLSMPVEDQSTKKVRVSSSRQLRNRRTGEAYLFLLPYILAMLAFGLGPGIYALLISFADYSTGLPRYFGAGFKELSYGNSRPPVRIYFRQHRKIPAHLSSHRNCAGGAAGAAFAYAPRESFIHPEDAFFHSRCSCRPGCSIAGHFYVDPKFEPIWFLA